MVLLQVGLQETYLILFFSSPSSTSSFVSITLIYTAGSTGGFLYRRNMAGGLKWWIGREVVIVVVIRFNVIPTYCPEGTNETPQNP